MRTQRHDVSPDLDIALVGVPFDLGVNYRSGSRQGPAAVREASRLIRRVHNVSGIAPYDICNVADVGDAPVNPIDLLRSIDMIEDFFARIHTAGALPLTIGGDHTVPLPILRAVAKHRPVGIGLMGFQDCLHELRIPTASQEAVEFADTEPGGCMCGVALDLAGREDFR
jgi:guanidinopropionase